MAAHEEELTMADLNLTHTAPDTTVTPETFDLAAWIAGVTPVQRTVTLYARGDLFADLSALETRYDEAKRAANVDDMRALKEQMREVADMDERGIDGDQATLEQLAAQITAPEGLTVDMLATLRDRIEPQVVALVQAVATVNTMKPTISVPS